MATHPIVHVEIATNNPKGSGEFYRQLFGWQIMSSEALNYTMWQPEGGTGGGTGATCAVTGDVPSTASDAMTPRSRALGARVRVRVDMRSDGTERIGRTERTL